MRQASRFVGFALLVALAAGRLLAAQEPSAEAPVLTNHPTFQASLERITRGSALFRADVEAIRAAGRRVYVLTPDAVTVVEDGATSGFDPLVLADVAVVGPEDGSVDAVLVVVNLRLLAEGHSSRGASNAQRNADLDRILVHEVYGHALPYLLAGDRSGRCPDPADGELATEACSIRRENAVRAELGLGHRHDYGLASLAVARAWR